MKLNYLFPNKYKKFGWIVLIPSVIIGLIAMGGNLEPAFLNVEVPAVFIDELFGKTKLIGFVQNNILNEIIGVLIILSAFLVAFSKEKQEDEFISKIRLECLVWAVYLNYAILIIAILFIFDMSFMWVIIFNMFTILFFFIARFNWEVSKLKKSLI